LAGQRRDFRLTLAKPSKQFRRRRGGRRQNDRATPGRTAGAGVAETARCGDTVATRPHDTAPVAPTEEGERLLKTLGPALNDIAAELSSLSKLRKKPAGTIRINPILMGR
jgi:hypothetical protein